MARCHRIGQEKEVTVYRLVSKDTYEQQLFDAASRKYGLEEALLGAGSGNPEEVSGARGLQVFLLDCFMCALRRWAGPLGLRVCSLSLPFFCVHFE